MRVVVALSGKRRMLANGRQLGSRLEVGGTARMRDVHSVVTGLS